MTPARIKQLIARYTSMASVAAGTFLAVKNQWLAIAGPAFLASACSVLDHWLHAQQDKAKCPDEGGQTAKNNESIAIEGTASGNKSIAIGIEAVANSESPWVGIGWPPGSRNAQQAQQAVEAVNTGSSIAESISKRQAWLRDLSGMPDFTVEIEKIKDRLDKAERTRNEQSEIQSGFLNGFDNRLEKLEADLNGRSTRIHARLDELLVRLAKVEIGRLGDGFPYRLKIDQPSKPKKRKPTK